MKNTYSCLLALIVILSTTAHAKTTGVNIPNIFPHYGSGAQSYPPGITQSRIIGQIYLEHDGTAFISVDSIKYTYSFGRGGYLSTEDQSDNFVNFDTSYTYLFNSSLGTYRNQFRRVQEFNETNKVKKYTCETWRVSTGAWKDSSRFIYTYNNDQTRLDFTQFQISYAGAWIPHVDYLNLYDGNNRVIKMNSTAYKMELDYDNNNNIVERRDSMWSSQQSWKPYYKHLFSYNAINQVISYIVEDYNGLWLNYKKYEYAYNGNDLQTTTEYDWVNNAWTVSGKHLFSYDNNHNKLVDIFQYWDANTNAFVNDVKLQWTYNSFNQPLTYYSESWEPFNSSWTNTTNDFLFRYYYQSYTPTSVNRFVADDIRMELYPQPAQQTLNVRVFLEKPEPYTIAIYNMQGKIVKQYSGANINIEQSIPVNDLVAGSYFLKINTIDKQQSRQFVVVH